MAIEDNLVNGWTAEDKRSLLDLVTGGKYSEAKDLPPLSTTGKVTDENISSLLDVFSENPDVEYIGGAGPLLGALSTVGVIRTASTASKLFRGWRHNLEQFMKSAKERNHILRDALKILDEDDIKITKHGLHIINKEYGLTGKVLVPEIKGAAGGAAKQAKKARGSTIQEQQRITNRQSRDLAAERREQFNQERIDKNLERGSRRSGKY
jgi:hypothetical protein